MLISARLLYNRSNTTLALHLRVLGRLLSMEEPSPNGPKKDASSLSVRLLRYVVATSYAKITHRLKHKTLSQPYIRSLKTVDTFNVVESELEQPTHQGTENDRLFLIKFF